MSVKDDVANDFTLFVLTVVTVGLGLWYLERKVTGALANAPSAAGKWISDQVSGLGQSYWDAFAPSASLLADITEPLAPLTASSAGQVPAAVDAVQATVPAGGTATSGDYQYEASLMGLGN